MDEKRIEAALKALGSNTPRVPEKTVNDMVKTVRVLNARKQALAGKQEPAAEISAKRTRELTAEKKPPAAGMKK